MKSSATPSLPANLTTGPRRSPRGFVRSSTAGRPQAAEAGQARPQPRLRSQGSRPAAFRHQLRRSGIDPEASRRAGHLPGDGRQEQRLYVGETVSLKRRLLANFTSADQALDRSGVVQDHLDQAFQDRCTILSDAGMAELFCPQVQNTPQFQRAARCPVNEPEQRPVHEPCFAVIARRLMS